MLHPSIQRKPTKSIISINSSCNEVKSFKRWRAFPSCIQIQSHHINDQSTSFQELFTMASVFEWNTTMKIYDQKWNKQDFTILKQYSWWGNAICELCKQNRGLVRDCCYDKMINSKHKNYRLWCFLPVGPLWFITQVTGTENFQHQPRGNRSLVKMATLRNKAKRYGSTTAKARVSSLKERTTLWWRLPKPFARKMQQLSEPKDHFGQYRTSDSRKQNLLRQHQKGV